MPVVQLALDGTKPLQYHLELGAKLAPAREEGVLIMGSGNTVHYLGRLDWSRPDAGYDWAVRFGGASPTGSSTGTRPPARLTPTRLRWPPARPLPARPLPGRAGDAAGEHCAPLVEGFAFGSLSMDSFTLGAPAA